MNIKKSITRQRRHHQIRQRLQGTKKRPRLCVFKSNRHVYAQLIDDEQGKTLAAVSDVELKKQAKSDVTKSANLKDATAVGELIAAKADKNKIKQVVFDRGGFKYHGLVKAVADGARKGKLKF
ncbi:50S ribosomal protein L18 [Patescibacteria group bacterium]|nr:50S ribosomal protein L18 [Patescibacteria group bacterium]